MVYKSLVLGVLFSSGIFAGKSGLGLAYLLGRTSSPSRRCLQLFLFALTYALLFVLAAWGLRRFDLPAHLETIQKLLQGGMTVHLLMAGMMIAWGLALLRRNHHQGASRGWLLLILPCPVCVTVIVFSLAFVLALFPDNFLRITGGLYLVFLAISLSVGLAMAGVMSSLGRRTTHSAENLLGGAMVLLGAYFLLSMVVLPQFADVDKIYRLARHKTGGSPETLADLLPLVLFFVFSFTVGFGRTYKKIRSVF